MTDLYLRTVLVTLRGGAPWGFRLIGGGPKPLRISKIRRRSKAHEAGLQPGDVLLSVNGMNCANTTHEYAVQLISRSSESLTLELGREAERVLVFHNDVADYEEPEEQNVQEQEPPGRTHVAEVHILPEMSAQEPETEFIEDTVPKVIPASDDVTPVPIVKLLKEASPEPVPFLPSDKKKYGDSSFFNDPSKNFPTIEEEKQMAQRVAQALTDVRNKTSRGASMFEKRRQRSAKWITEDDVEVFGIENQSVEGTPMPEGAGIPKPYNPAGLPIPPPPPPPPFPGAAPAKNVQHFVEEIKKAPKVAHNAVPPTKCFDIASALHNNMGRGAQIFARRRARSEKWVVEAEDADDSPPPQTQAQPFRVLPTGRDPVVVARIGCPPQSPAQSAAGAQLRSQIRPMVNANQTTLVQNRYSMVEGGNARLVDTQTSLAVSKAPPMQTKTFNTQPKGWRPVA